MAPINLSDPTFEPTDEQLRELSRRAFAHVPAARDAEIAEMRARIRHGREALRAKLASRPARHGSP